MLMSSYTHRKCQHCLANISKNVALNLGYVFCNVQRFTPRYLSVIRSEIVKPTLNMARNN